MVALNLADLAARRGISFDEERLSERLGVPVVAVAAVRRGDRRPDGSDPYRHPGRVRCRPRRLDPVPAGSIDDLVAESMGGHDAVGAARTCRRPLDKAFTHPILGLLVFVAVMSGLWTIFSLAGVPMDLVDGLFGTTASSSRRPSRRRIHDLAVDGIIGGIAGTVIFLRRF